MWTLEFSVVKSTDWRIPVIGTELSRGGMMNDVGWRDMTKMAIVIFLNGSCSRGQGGRGGGNVTKSQDMTTGVGCQSFGC